MTGKLFLFHWNAAEAEEIAAEIRGFGFDITIESSDGARGGKAVKESPPDVIVIYLIRLPSHGRETAHALKSMKATREIPIVFVDGEGEALEKTKAKVPDAIYTSSAKLKSTLSKYLGKR